MGKRKRKIGEKNRDIIVELCEVYDIGVNFLQPFQMRLTKDNQIIDLYPQSCRFFNVRKNIWGNFTMIDLEEFIMYNFDIKYL